MKRYRMWAVLSVLCLAAMVACPAALGQSVYYVDQGHPSASDSSAGSEAAPWLTIGHAIGSVTAGDTVYVKEGIYREGLTLNVSGTAGNPITLQAYPGDRAVISGASAITGWTQCTSAIAGGNPDYATIYYVDIPRRVLTLHQDNVRVWKSRVPEHGYWVIDNATATSLTDTENLTQPDDFWNGAEAFIWRVQQGQQAEAIVTDFNQASGTLTVEQVKYVSTTGDLYFMENKVDFINEPGDWATAPIGGGNYRLFFWPNGGGSPNDYLIESPDPDVRDAGTLIDLRRESYWVFDGLEIRHATGSGIGSGKSDDPMPGHNLIQNCLIHHHHGVGVDESFTDSTTYRRNAVLYNGELSGTGMRIVAPATNIIFEENEVAWNYKDGMKLQGADTIIRRNYVHSQWMYQHADNMQTSGNGADDMLLEDNLIFDGGQSFMISNMRGLTARNNTIVGSRANSMIFNGTYLILESNTIAFAGTGPLAPSGDSFNFSDNALVTGHNNQIFVMDSSSSFVSDYNLFYFAEGIDEMDGPVVIYDRRFTSRGLADYQADSGQDAHSLFANPMFANAPIYYCKLPLKDRITEFTASRIYMYTSNIPFFNVGDYVEIDWDGVVRTVTAVGADYIEFDPPETRVQFKAQALCNWGDSDDFALDLTPAPGSPLIGNGSGGGNIGSTIDVQEYMMCDFDGDGVRDVPVYLEDPNGVDPGTPGDADGDGDVDLDDFVILKQTFLQSPLVDDRADFDGDGDVDLDDFVILKLNFTAAGG